MESTETAVRREVIIAASAETVWELLSDPAKATRWMGIEAWFEPRPDGLYRVAVTHGQTARGTFVEIDPPHRLVFTWGWEEDGASVAPGSSTVEIDLVPEDGGTRVVLTHSGLDRKSGERHAVGWEHYLARLAVTGAGGDPGPDPWLAG